MNRKLMAVLPLLIVSLCFAQQQTSDDYFTLIRKDYSGDLAYETVEFVEKYWRVAGNTGFNNTVYRIAEKLEAAGYVLESNASALDRMTYRIEKRPLKNPTWEPVDATVSIVGQEGVLLQHATNRNMMYLNSFSTSKNGVIGELVFIKTPEQLKSLNVKGKIVYAEFSARKIFEEAIVNQGALGIITYNNPSYLQPAKNTTSIQFRSFRSQKHTKAWGIALSYAANETLKKALSLGKVELKVNVQTKIYPSEELTVVADIKGSKYTDERLVFSAHIQEPGANDNATGVGAQLEMAVLAANLIHKGELDIDRSLTYLWGDEIISTHRYITEDKTRAKTIKWGVSLDMVGENTAITGGSFLIEKMPDPSAIWTRGTDKHTEWGGKVLNIRDMKPHFLNDFVLNTFKKQGKYAGWEVKTNPFEGGSDHIPFLKADIPSVLLWHFTDQFYHTDNDRIDKVSKETLKNVGTAALVTGITLLNADTKTAMNTLGQIDKAAQKRMAEEFLLSLESIKSGNSLKKELKIMKAWQSWYLKTINSVSELERQNSQQLSKAIKLTHKNLKKSTKTQIKALKKAI